MHDSLKCHPDCECIECEGDFSLRTKAIFWIWTMLIGVCFWAGLFWFFMVSTAAAQEAPICGKWSVVRDNLRKNVGMVEVGGGLINEKTTLIIVANPEGEWASLAVGATGVACLMAQGEGWFQARIPALGERPA